MYHVANAVMNFCTDMYMFHGKHDYKFVDKSVDRFCNIFHVKQWPYNLFYISQANDF
jgi:hypothetical protein